MSEYNEDFKPPVMALDSLPDNGRWELQLLPYSYGWAWSTSKEGTYLEYSGWSFTKRGAIWSMRRARKKHEKKKKTEVWFE